MAGKVSKGAYFVQGHFSRPLQNLREEVSSCEQNRRGYSVEESGFFFFFARTQNRIGLWSNDEY